MESKDKSIHVYCHGSSSTVHKDSPGAYAFIVVDDETWGKYQEVGREFQVSYNRMSLTAIWKGLIKAITLYNPEVHSSIKIYSSCRYIINAMNKGYAYKWSQNKWKGLGTSYPIKHQDLWIPLLYLSREFPVEYIRTEALHHQIQRFRNDYPAQVHNLAFNEMQKYAIEHGFKYKPKHFKVKRYLVHHDGGKRKQNETRNTNN